MFVSTKKAAEITGLHPNTLRKMADNGEIEFYRLSNGDRRFNVSSYIKKECVICYSRVNIR